MTVAAELVVLVSGKEVGVTDLLRRVQAQGQQAEEQVRRLQAALAGLGGGLPSQLPIPSLPSRQPTTPRASRAADEALRLAQAQARLALAEGDATRATTILNAALSANAGASERASLSVQTQVARLQNGRTTFQQYGDAVRDGLLGIVGPAAAATAALGAVTGVAQSFIDAFNFKTQLDATTASINSQLQGVRDTRQVWAEAAATGQTYRITQQETNEILASSVDVLRTSRSSVGELEIALLRLQSRDPSKPISEAARALRELNAGDTATIKELFNIGAQDANKMKAEIAGGADAVQVLTAFLDRAGSGMDILAQRTTGALGAMNELKLAQEELTKAQAEFAQGPGLELLEARTNVIRGLSNVMQGNIVVTRESTAATQDWFAKAVTVVGALAGNSAAADAAQRQQAFAAQEAAAAEEQAAAAAQFTAAANAGLAASADAVAQAYANANIATGQSIPAQLGYASSLEMGSIQARAAALAAEQKANADQVAAVDAQTHAVAQQQLAQQAQVAAQALLANGQQGANSAALLAQSSSQIDVLTAAYYRLAAAQAAAAQAKVNADALRDQRAGERDGGSSRTFAQITLEANGARLRAASLRRSEEEARKIGRAGGAARLSDQQKLNNQLLNDQQRFDDQAEAQAREHAQRVLDIERDYQEKSLAQQRRNEISKRESELDFLKSITTSQLNETERGRAEVQRINERYYADFEEAQRAAQAGNAQLSEELVEQARERAATEQRYAEEIAQAEENKQRDQVARLEALREKERLILDEKRKQTLEDGDANVQGRQDALTEEDARFQEQQEKNALAAENASQRKIDAARRSGKEVSDENTALLEQERILNRIGKGPGAPGTTTPVAASSTTSAAPAIAAPSGLVDLSTLAAGLERIAGEVAAARAAIVRSQDNTTSAVRSLSGVMR